ncbi:MAG: PEP-CTERM sorting domain-containing protein [Gammaproteobacteria bacterium]|jgi:hypothetical protein
MVGLFGRRSSRFVTLLTLAVGLLAFSSGAFATLDVRAAYQNAALSIDGVVSTGPSDIQQVQVDTPTGATVLAAYLYVSDVFGSGATGDVTLNGTFIPQADGTLLTPDANPANTRVFDVTSIMAPAITGGLQNFDYSESGYSDGAALAVIYRTPTTDGTAILMDGELAQAGDTTRLDFSEAYTSGDVIMSLASSYSYNGDSDVNATGQVTTVDVTTDSTTSRRLTGCAGGNDDGNFISANGQLMTVGGIGDSSDNPDPTCAGGAGDDELYNLGAGNSADPTAFLQAGDTFVELDTTNPSFDDNVFFLAFTSTFTVSSVDGEVIPDDGGPTSVPEPGVLGLLGIGLVGIACSRRRKKL